MQVINRLVWDKLKNVPHVRGLDGYAWTKSRCADYDDQIHHSRLAFDQIVRFLSHECHAIKRPSSLSHVDEMDRLGTDMDKFANDATMMGR